MFLDDFVLFSSYCTELFYRENPMKIVRCHETYMYDQLGNKYLDCINNVAHGRNEGERLFEKEISFVQQLAIAIRTW